jgi:hypothetical protein
MWQWFSYLLENAFVTQRVCQFRHPAQPPLTRLTQLGANVVVYCPNWRTVTLIMASKLS